MDKINLTDIQKETLINCGAFRYSVEKTANVLDLDFKIVSKLLSNNTSDFFKMYKKGADMYDYAVDLKLFEMVRGGDLKALSQLEKRRGS